MFFGIKPKIFITTAVCTAILTATGSLLTGQESTIDFGRDIRPILSNYCYECHGPDQHERQADLRLDNEQGVQLAEDLIAPGLPEDSELLIRVFSDDEDHMMPPMDFGKTLSADQKNLLRQWINEGATWRPHWSLVAPRKQTPPSDELGWGTNAVDRFVLQTLTRNALAPNPRANRRTLIRRLSLDLTGLPPSPELLQKFVHSDNQHWYEELVDQLLDSPHYGEHMARFWLDASRYADTHGLHLDNYREMWLYRDWVINAYNTNKPYREFIVEQLAGDLLDNPSEEQLIATGFNRAHVTTNEGGSIVEEVRTRNVVDRVSTTGTVFLGLTVGCAQCHDHKYDPISQKEFYQMYAFFNALDGKAMDGNIKDHAPVLRRFSESETEALAALRLESKTIQNEIDTLIAEFNYQEPDTESETIETQTPPTEFIWFDDTLPEGAKKTGAWRRAPTDGIPPASGKYSFVNNHKEFAQIFFVESKRPLRFSDDDTLFAYVFLDPKAPPQEIMLQFNDGSWEHRVYWGENKINFGKNDTTSRKRLGDLPELGKWVKLEVQAKDVGFKKSAAVNGLAYSQYGGRVLWDKAGVVTAIPQSYRGTSFRQWKQFQQATGSIDLTGPLKKLLNKKHERTEADEKLLLEHFLKNDHPESKQLIGNRLQRLKTIREQIDVKTKAAPTTLIWKEQSSPKPTFMLNRGQYDQPGEEVSRKTPAALPPFSDGMPYNRLGLAQWLVDPAHPLTARVTVNRIWQQFFGVGIVSTSEDFGAQGDLPSHPALLDWLAVDFIESNWDVQRLVKQIVTSSTYRQSSKLNAAKLAKDRGNRLLSRGPRLRLDAEVLRDQALAVSGLLVDQIGGPTVKPPQPAGLWFAVGYSRSNTVCFKSDQGSDKVHRRSLYTFWKRTAPPPQMSVFDAPSRESCVVRRERTNTPLQALLLMNDPQYVEAARHLAQGTMESACTDDTSKIRFMFHRALSREPKNDVVAILATDLETYRQEFLADEERAKKLVDIGASPANEKYDRVELASLTMLANLIMNLDEFVSKN